MRHPTPRGAGHQHANHGAEATVSVVDVPRLMALLGRIKVRELARLAEMSVERLAVLVVRASGAASALARGDVPAVRRRPKAVPGAPRVAARRWLVVGTSELMDGNRARAARILGTSRRRVREDLATYAAERKLGSED